MEKETNFKTMKKINPHIYEKETDKEKSLRLRKDAVAIDIMGDETDEEGIEKKMREAEIEYRQQRKLPLKSSVTRQEARELLNDEVYMARISKGASNLNQGIIDISIECKDGVIWS